MADTDLCRRPATPCEQFFEALDRHMVTVGVNCWRLEIYAVIVHADRRWIQLSLQGPRRLEMCLKMALDRSPDDVLDSLRAFLGAHDGRSVDGVVETVIID